MITTQSNARQKKMPQEMSAKLQIMERQNNKPTNKKTVNLIDLLLKFIGVVGDETKQNTYYDDGEADDDDRH